MEQRVTTSTSDGLTSYLRLCVNFPWASTNRLNVTAPGKHKQQATVCRNATARMQHGNNAADRCGGVMKKFKRRSAATSVCISLKDRGELKNTWLACIFML
ncbi:Hypothetical predicted protein [Scomber scombrus]|uniref:Uncharacterized protein n=1 Tax=Scomber scombrus TaxID=13677 RepID=A0AAV1N2P5_SCOSC